MSSTQTHLSIPTDLHPLVFIPGVEDVLGEVEGKTLFMDPQHTENPSELHEVLTVLLADS